MGSFNIQCFASKQVIAERENCRVVMLLQSSTYTPVELSFRGQQHSLYGVSNHACGPNAFWKPMGAFLEATYADYGKFELHDTAANRKVLADLYTTLYRGTAVAALGENPSHETAFDFKEMVQAVSPKLAEGLSSIKSFWDSLSPEKLDFAEAVLVWDKLEEAIYRNRVFCADGSQVLRPVRFGALHELAFKGLISMAEGSWLRSGLPYERHAYFEHFLGELKAELATVENDMKRFVMKDSARELLALRMSSSEVHAMLWPFRESFNDSIESYTEKGTGLEAFLAENQALLDSVYALKGLDELNLVFEPYLTGGQDYDNRTGQAYAAFVSFTERQVSKARQARYEE